MVGVLHVTQTFTWIGLLWQEVFVKLSRQSVKWYNHVPSISNLLKLDVGYFFVVNHSWVMSRNITWEFWEVRRHFYLICKFYRKMQGGSLSASLGTYFFI